jgi:Ni/Fe-hydrogenase subunit HybB-like protein
MNAIWAYFTYAEHLGVAAGQLTEEFPVLASKLWGEFAPGFWAMVALMGVAFWVLVVPRLLPGPVRREARLRPRYALAALGIAPLALLLAGAGPLPEPAPSGLVQTAGWLALGALVLVAGLGLASWLKGRAVAATVIAAACVVVGMWLERWNIIVPTMTHPRLMPYAFYTPSTTEIALTSASIALFLLMFLVFFKLFPAVSIWEVIEGRVVEAARAQIDVPGPVAANAPRPRRWGFKR